MPPLLDQIEQRCREYGHEVVLVDEGIPLTGEEFLGRARNLCSDMQALGVESGSRVGLSMAPCADLMVSIAGTWMAGAAFVPLDPDEVPVRRRAILEDSRVRAVLGGQSHDEPYAESPDAIHASVAGGRVVSVRGSGRLPRPSDHEGAQDEAYVIFTSGSSGRPKGVSVGHQAIATYVRQASRVFEVPSGGMAFPVHLPPTFDASLTSLLLPLVTKNIALPVADPVSPTRALAALLRAVNSPILVKTTPSQLRLLSDLLTSHDVDRLAGSFVIGGEVLDYAGLAWLRRNSRLAIFNEYGPTETTVGCAVYRIRADDPTTGPVPIGFPHDGTIFTVLPEAGGPEHSGIGELVIAGPAVANGYLASAPVDSFAQRDGMPSYRTGDRVRRDSSGMYHFLGRSDDQIKLDGFRIELGEVEAALRLAAGDRAVAAVTVNGRLVGVVEAPPDLDLTAVATGLRDRLPPYMRPADMYAVSAFPLTDHGKVDRRQLADRFAGSTTAVPRLAADVGRDTNLGGDLDAAVASVWAALLGRDNISVDTDFFAEGAHSITALKMVGRLTADLGYEVPLSLAFDHPTLHEFVTALRDHVRHDESAGRSATPSPDARTPAATQLAILTAENLSPGPAAFTVVDAVRVAGIDDWGSLRRAAVGTIARHDAFSWRFAFDNSHRVIARGGWQPGQAGRAVESIDLRGLSATQAKEVVDRRLADARRQRIDLLAGEAAARILLFRTGPDAGGGEADICALVAHHAVVDEISTGLFWNEMFARLQGQPVPDTADFRYADWSRERTEPGLMGRARRSAHVILTRLLEAPLGSLAPATNQQPPSTGEFSLAFEVNEDLARRAAAAAGRFAVPLSSLYGAAAVRAFGSMVPAPRFALFTPMTLRRSVADFEVIGCFVARVPVLAECPDVPESAAVAVRRWHQSVGFFAQHADADVSEIAARMRLEAPGWPASPRLSLAIETPHAGRAGLVEWASLTTVGGPPKHGVTIFLTPGTPRRQGRGRIVWRAGVLDIKSAGVLADGLVAALTAISGTNGPLPPPRGDGKKSATMSDATPVRDNAGGGNGQSTGDSSASVLLARDLAALAGTVLERPIAPDDNLFEAGARSLDLVRLAAAIDRTYGVRLSATDIFDLPTAVDLAGLVLIGNDAGRVERTDR